MQKTEGKYYTTARIMDQALLLLLEKKDLEFITVKDIVQKAGVSRSTFYLHYDNIYELLEECLEMLNEEFSQSFKQNGIEQVEIGKEPFLITSKHLIPYLNFAKRNKRILKLVHQKPQLFQVNKTYQKIYSSILYPAISHYNVPEEKKTYLLEFYTQGTTAIVYKWLENDCNSPIEDIVKIIKDCIGEHHA